ncbi:UTP--glucose-1-phosphate uridylyltransferase [Mucisphaera calidilacus]|uniref:Putative uridylyltransferase n=1 Tax=Mucisphaera calidilacus TaxID=2527982 RepID=A0A518C0D3_9BACT|nr:UDPGP type 1 family protein [Mucisphaera calidilacus]QDU72679.1 putative uridylyltransferase [Mucisphaera calidilacus]
MIETTSEQYTQALETLKSIGQEHVLASFDQLDAGQQAALLAEIASVDWQEVHRLIGTHVLDKPTFELPTDIEPAPWFPNVPTAGEQESYYHTATEVGRAMIAAGKVAAFTVAGGQGTRLGWDGPKGTFPATPIRHLPLFGCFAEYIRACEARFGVTIRWYIMTSPANDTDTREFLTRHQFFGLDPAQVMIFPQGMMPAVDPSTGKVLMASKGSIALSPNGHGGSLKALETSGALKDMEKHGIEHISYTQVDNPIVRVLDPVFLGLHAISGSQMSSKMLPKAYPTEKLGNFCFVDGRMTIIEYSDLPDELAYETLENGELRFRAGSIAIHAIRRDFVENLNRTAGGFALPYHRANKKVPFYDPKTDTQVKPDEPNAVKLETFVFDALPLCSTSIVYETERVDEFAPIKNADTPAGDEPANDSPETSRNIQTERAARWLSELGVHIPRREDGTVDAAIEISQITAIYKEDLDRSSLPDHIRPGQELLL